MVGVWLAVTEATLVNGCLHVLPGSQSEPVHPHVPDHRPGANYGYFEIVDHDMATSPNQGADGAGRPPGLRQPPDALLDGQRDPTGSWPLMVYHYAAAGTIDHTEGSFPTVNDSVPVRRGGRATAPPPAYEVTDRWR